MENMLGNTLGIRKYWEPDENPLGTYKEDSGNKSGSKGK
jgi:hypothetical protein